MAIFDRDDLRALIEQGERPAVSVYMPTHRAGTEVQQDPIRFKNLLREARDRLTKQGLRSTDAESMLEPGRRLLDDEVFWQHQSDGLVAFADPSAFRHYRLPYSFEELVVVAERFHVKPLLRLLSGDGRFYVLAISGKDVRLFQGTRHSVAEVDLENVPKGLEEALRFDDPEKQLQFHTTAQGAAAIFHGQGVGTDAAQHKKDLLRYFQQVDRGLHDLLRDDNAPLILAGVDYLLPIYREANSYSYLLDGGITGNPDDLDARALHDRAWDLVEPHFRQTQHEKAAQYRNLKGTGRVANEVEAILPAAYHGRIDTLFVKVGVHQWGRYDAGGGQVTRHAEPAPGDEDLLDLAAVQTLLHGGEVYAVEVEEMPDGTANGEVAALFRY